MASINDQGMIVDPKVKLKRYLNLEHGPLAGVKAIVVHQTDSSTIAPILSAYSAATVGAHFLIDKNGQIYQTASINKRCYHVGKYLKSKCLTINPQKCDSQFVSKIASMKFTERKTAINKHERAKDFPDRYPVNSDSIGIEMIGVHTSETTYEAPTVQQNASLKWLVNSIHSLVVNISKDEVYRHPDLSYKNPGEASGAKWK